jgi:hypothetical protein
LVTLRWADAVIEKQAARSVEAASEWKIEGFIFNDRFGTKLEIFDYVTFPYPPVKEKDMERIYVPEDIRQLILLTKINPQLAKAEGL